MMEKDAFEVIDKINNGQSESSSSSSFFEYSLSSPQEKKLDSSSTTIHESSASGEHSTFSTALDEKLSSLQTQTTELRQQFKNRNQILRDEILQISEKQQSILKENEKLRKEIQNQEITVLSDDESDYSIIVPSENALKEKADESVIFQETLLQLHELTSKYTKLSQELVEERLKSDNLEKLLNEKDEQNRILKQFFDAAKQQSLKNAELQSELDSVKKELASTKLKLRELSEKAEESSREVEEHKEKFSRLQVSNAEIINALQTKAKFLFDALDAAEHDHGAARTCLAVAREKLEKVSNENKEMVELLSSLKVENEELKMERTVKDCEHQEQLDNLTAKLVDTEQRLERVQVKLSLNIGIPNEPSQNSSQTDGIAPAEKHEETSVKDQGRSSFRCPQCFMHFSSTFTEFEEHVQNCYDLMNLTESQKIEILQALHEVGIHDQTMV